MKKFKIRYKDPDPCCPVFNMTVKAYDAEHAQDLFWGNSVDQSWVIISVKEVRGS